MQPINKDVFEIVIYLCAGLFLLVVAGATAFWLHHRTPGKGRDTAMENLYDALVRKDPEHVAQRLHIDIAQYYQNCSILGLPVKIKTVCIQKLIGIICLVLGGLSLVLTSALWSLLIILVGFALILLPEKRVADKAQQKKDELREDLPRFLDLLQTALKAGIPVSTAIKRTAESVDCMLSDELKKALVDVELGADTWQSSLYKMAAMYGVDSFSEFVMSIVTAYEKGIPVHEAVTEESRHLKMEKLLNAKEKASKISNTITFPIMVFSILPLMVLVLLPYISQISQGGL